MSTSLNISDVEKQPENIELKSSATPEPNVDSLVENDSPTTGKGSFFNRIIVKHSPRSLPLWLKHKKAIVMYSLIISLTLYLIFGIMVTGFKNCKDLFGILVFGAICVFYVTIRDNFGTQINVLVFKPLYARIDHNWRVFRWFAYGGPVLFVVLWIILDTIKDVRRLQSVFGLVVFIFLAYCMSVKRRKVVWRPVLWGLSLQFIFGILILRTKGGYDITKYLGDKVTIFLEFSTVGVEFVFGATYYEHFIAFKVLMVIVFFTSVASILYYWGVLQVIMKKLAWLMFRTLHVSGVEALCAAANIFVGMMEAPLMVSPYVEQVTMSELHSIMTSGLATVAGGMLAAYVSLGIDAQHVMSASVMSAPASLAISKLMYPETEVPATSGVAAVKMEERKEKNVIEAAARGASVAVGIVANIGANLIAFFSLLAFVNAVLSYLGGLVAYPELSFEVICSYVFAPISFLMGVEWNDCMIVAKLVGVKTFINEFLAFNQLSILLKNRQANVGPMLSHRSEILAIYVLTGFTNFLSVGIFLGGYGQLAPSRKSDMAKIAVRTLIAATLACMVTACVAGILYMESWDASSKIN